MARENIRSILGRRDDSEESGGQTPQDFGAADLEEERQKEKKNNEEEKKKRIARGGGRWRARWLARWFPLCTSMETSEDGQTRRNLEGALPSPQNIRENEETPKKPLQPSNSDSNLSQVHSKDKCLELADPLGESLLNNLELLEGLASYLDSGDPYGNPKCWKHLAQHFGVEANCYETFTYSPRGPTEKLFVFVISRDADTFTIDMLKSGLRGIERGDIITNILVKHQDLDSKLTDATPVEKLSQTWPSVFDDITRLLDTVKPGVNNWKQLAGKLNVPKTEHQNFEESDDPSMKVLEYFMATDRNPTVGRLRGELENLGMTKASQIISKSEKVTDNNLLEEFFDKDLDAAMDLCSVLNQRHGRLIRRWRHLGNKLGITKNVLDTFSLHEREIISPTHALINHLGASQPYRTMQDLIFALHSIGRQDALRVVTNYFPVGRIEKFLNQKKQASDVLSHETP